MDNILISGYYGFNNAGDEAILKGLLQGIQEVNPEANIVVFSKYPVFTAKKHAVRAVNRMNPLRIFREIQRCDLLVSGGGSLLQDVTSKRSLIYYLALIWIAKIFKKKVMIYSQGIGPINKKFNKFLAKRIIQKVDFINVRDEESKKELQKMGIKQEILVTTDTVFGLNMPNTEKGKKILQKMKLDLDKKIVGISVRPWAGKNDEIVNKIASVCEYIVEKYDAQVLLIPFHFYGDLNIVKKTKEAVNANFVQNVQVLTEYLYVEDYLSLMGNLDLTIAMRLHGLIFSVGMKVPIIPISYDPKIDNFAKNVGKDFIVNVENINIDDIIYQVDAFMKNPDKERKIIEKKAREFAAIAHLHNRALLDLLKK